MSAVFKRKAEQMITYEALVLFRNHVAGKKQAFQRPLIRARIDDDIEIINELIDRFQKEKPPTIALDE